MLEHAQLFHIGIRVTHFTAAMDEVGARAGVTWASRQDNVMDVWLPDDGHVSLPLALTYSVEGPVHLELMQGPPGSIWDGNDAPGAHHFGYWSDAVAEDTEALLAEGWTLELAAAAPDDGYGRFTHVRSQSGYLVEPVSSASKAGFERWWAGGPLRDPVA